MKSIIGNKLLKKPLKLDRFKKIQFFFFCQFLCCFILVEFRSVKVSEDFIYLKQQYYMVNIPNLNQLIFKIFLDILK